MITVAEISTRWNQRGYSPMRTPNVQGFSVDSAMDTDTDTWTIEIGDPDRDFTDVLQRDNEVRLNLYGLGDGRIETLHSGFADQITLDEGGTLTFQGRDISSVAVDSQHPPQIWHQIRPEMLVAREARALKIGDRLKLTPAKGFKTYATDGSESYWQVWYRFYRKRRMWMWAEPDASLIASELDYTQPNVYYFGTPFGSWGSDNPRVAGWLPVQTLEWRANKNQRVGEVYFFGHRGDIGFVARAADPTTSKWIKRPTRIITSGDVHNQAEARAEAWEEIFETKVGATEIKLTVKDPGFLIRQNSMAMVNVPQVGLRGEFYVVGVTTFGSITDGIYQQVRLREKKYAISRRVPSDPVLKGQDVSEKTQFRPGGIAASLGVRWKWYFVAATNKYRGPWPFELFLGVLLSICQQESGFHNYRQGGHIEWPGTQSGDVPSIVTENAEYNKFASTFANEISAGRVGTEWGVGPMQLTTPGYKHLADRLGGTGIDELAGARWNPQWNIMAAAAALASKLGAGVSISADGEISKSNITGLSLNPTEANIWPGVKAYNGTGPKADHYMRTVKSIYNDTYKTVVSAAVTAGRQDAKNPANLPGGSSAELRNRVLNNSRITFTKQSQRDDIRYGRIHDEPLRALLWITSLGYDCTISALKSDHTHLGSKSAHFWGLAFDLGNYNFYNVNTSKLMKLLGDAKTELGFDQLIGPDPDLVIAGNLRGQAAADYYGAQTMRDHKTHIHLGWPISLAKTGKR